MEIGRGAVEDGRCLSLPVEDEYARNAAQSSKGRGHLFRPHHHINRKIERLYEITHICLWRFHRHGQNCYLISVTALQISQQAQSRATGRAPCGPEFDYYYTA